MFVNNEETVVGAVSTAMIGFGGFALRKIAAKAAPTVGLALAAVAVSAAFFVMPQAALAANECEVIGVDPSVNGATADSYDCDQTSYPDGVTYDADGDLTVTFTATPTSNIGGSGISLDALGSDSIFFDSATTATELDSAGATAALLGVTTVNGNIDIDVEEMDADFAPTTHGIFAQSTGTGSIDIVTTGNVDAQSGTNPDTSIGIEALTNSGDITLTTGSTVTGNMAGIQAVSGSGDISMVTNGTVGGFSSQYGIRAETGGAGTLTLTALGQVSVSNSIGVAAIEATTGTGLLSIDVNGSVSGAGGTAGILAVAGGNVEIDIAAGGQVTAFQGIALDLTAAGDITINNTGRISTGSSNADLLAIRAVGDTIVLNNNAGPGAFDGIRGALDFSGLTNGYVFNNAANAIWDMRTGLAVSTGQVGGLSTKPRVSTLGAGTFNNAGTILFGQNKEVVLAQGTSYNGVDAVMEMPVIAVDLTAAGQTGCMPDTVTVAGCLNLSGGETSGRTSILITTPTADIDTDKDLLGAANPGILLVDVSGGTSAAGHFVLHPDSENYLETSFYGPALTTGEPAPLVYVLLYNPDTQQHILSTVPTAEGIEYVSFIDESLSIWHTTADTVVGRQSDLRGGATGGGWVRLVIERTTRDAAPTMTTQGNSFTFDQGYEIDTRAVVFGFDTVTGDNYVIGLHGGLISSDTDYDGTGNGNETKGAAAGVYGGWWRDLGIGQLTVDATVNGNFLRLSHDASYEVTHSDVNSLGVRAEAGWRVPVIDGFYVQPLATAAYVTTNIERLELRLNDITFEDSKSQRAALGLRLGGDFEVQNGLTARYWLTGRAWNESAEDGRVEYATPGEPLTIADDLSGSFEEVSFGASLSNKEDNLSVYASGGTKFIDDVTNYNISVGGRLRW